MSPDDELLFLPLGGAGEIGMNLNLYGFGPAEAPKWLMVDLGVTFADGFPPGADVIMPDPTFIAERRGDLLGLVLTHAHEDHIGAVQYLWDQLRCPVYATPFTRAVLREKLGECPFGDEIEITEIPMNGRFSIGPYDIEMVTLTHSIPEPNALAIRTPLGTVMHTGDWKFDPDPVVGATSNETRLEEIGDEGVLAIVCDSTNVFSPGESGSEADLLESLTEQIRACKQRVAVACFASNVARLETIAKAARECGRDVAVAGRSIRRIEAAARRTGYLQDTPAFLTEDDVAHIPDDKLLLICTGSQGEPRAALARIASGDHPRIRLGEGDTVIFSSKIIPGNEVSIYRLQNDLVRNGLDIVTEKDADIHVSGHPNRDELVRMYQHVRPHVAVPVHGEFRHLAEHAKLARACQVPHAIVNENGGVVRLAPGRPEVVDHAPVGRLVLEGGRVVREDSELVRGRTRALFNGSAVATVVVDRDGNLIEDPEVSTVGLIDPDTEEVPEEVFDAIEDVVEEYARKRSRPDDEVFREALRVAVRRTFRQVFDKRPVTTVHLVRVD